MPYGLRGRGGPKRRPTRGQLIEDRAQSIDIGRWSDALHLAARLLGGHVARRPHNFADAGPPRVGVEALGQPEVADLGVKTRSPKSEIRNQSARFTFEFRIWDFGFPLQEDVGWFQIAMDDAALMGIVDGAGERLHQPGTRLGAQGRTVQLLGETRAVNKLQGHVGPAVVLADVMDPDDVGMLEAGDCLGFGAEAGDPPSRRLYAGQDHLEGDQAIEACLSCPVHHAHAAASAFRQDFVARDCRPVARTKPVLARHVPFHLRDRMRRELRPGREEIHRGVGLLGDQTGFQRLARQTTFGTRGRLLDRGLPSVSVSARKNGRHGQS